MLTLDCMIASLKLAESVAAGSYMNYCCYCGAEIVSPFKRAYQCDCCHAAYVLVSMDWEQQWTSQDTTTSP
jgi:hypothetical protein